MHLVNGECAVRAVADEAALAQRCGVRQGMGRRRLAYVTSSACRCYWLYRIDESLRIPNVVYACGRGLGPIGVAGSTVPCIPRISLSAHLRIPYFGGMYAMDQEVEVDAFRRRVTAGVRRVVAQHAHLDLISVAAVESQLKVALLCFLC